ncbi:hypothetical protein ACA910_006905 [Epithemia clementina (nom. ined.)]
MMVQAFAPTTTTTTTTHHALVGHYGPRSVSSSSSQPFTGHFGQPQRQRELPCGRRGDHRWNSDPTQLFLAPSSSSSWSSLMEQPLPSESVVNAIVQLAESSSSSSNNNNSNNSKGRAVVVAADVAAAAGVSLSQAQRDLTTLASVCQGQIAVDDDGQLIYTFDRNVRTTLAQNSVKYRALETWQSVWPYLFWGLRVTFGAALLASIAAIFSTIFILQSSSSSSSDDRDDRGSSDRRGGGSGLGMGWSYWWGPSPLDFFYFRPYGSYGYYARDNNQNSNDENNMGFLESVFSYVFGDGNPNPRLEEQRLTAAANLIRSYQGSVTAEQLAPFVMDVPDDVPAVPLNDDNENDNNEPLFINESYVLPIVTALNGEPRVTEDGDIVYVFPELQVTASEAQTLSSSSALTATKAASARESLILRRAGLSESASARDIQRLLEYNGYRIPRRVAEYDRKELVAILEQLVPPLTQAEEENLKYNSDPTLLQEREWKFSLASDLNKVLAGGLGIVNFGGAAYLGYLFSQIKAATAAGAVLTLPGWLGVVQGLYPVLLGYAVLFNVIPLVRNVWIQQQNTQIRQRNERRRKWKHALELALEESSKGGSRGGSSTRPSWTARLRRKLAAAQRMGTKMWQAGKTKIFDTAESTMEDLQQAKSQRDLQDFDRQLLSSSSLTGGATNADNDNDDTSNTNMQKLPASSSSIPFPEQDMRGAARKANVAVESTNQDTGSGTADNEKSFQ